MKIVAVLFGICALEILVFGVILWITTRNSGEEQNIGFYFLLLCLLILVLWNGIIAFFGLKNGFYKGGFPLLLFLFGIYVCEMGEQTNNPDYFLNFFYYFEIVLLLTITVLLLINMAYIKKYLRKSKYPVFCLLYCIVTIILLFSIIYSIIYMFDTESIAVSQHFVGENSWDIYLRMVYFSVVTFTSLGYGEYTPVSNLAICVAMSEVFMFTVIISIVVMSLVHEVDEKDSRGEKQ